MPQYIDFLHQLKQDEGKKECEVELAGEEPKVARLVGESVTSPDGKTEFRLALIDTTATHIARRELQESQNFLESILNNAPLFILI
ncbi:MAG: hypothetical protein ACOC2L_00180, partial [Candidatus Sumerlaeota bacterium]